MTATAEATHDAIAARLLASSAKQSYDPDVDIDWAAPLHEDMWFMQPERMSLYGTTLWDSLSHQQRIELSRHEVASIASVGLWFELILMQMMVRDLYDDDPRSGRMHYALTEIADECRHSTMFGKFVDTLGVPAYGPPTYIYQLGKLFKTIGYGVSSYAAILVAEEILDRWQRELLADERVQPLSRMVCRIHVLEEARHMTFARQQIETMMPKISTPMRAYHQGLVAQTTFMVARALVNPQVYAAVGLDPQEARRAAMHNPVYQDTLAWMGSRVTPYLQKQGLVPRATQPVWRKSALLRAG